MLKNWAANKLRADIIASFGAITADGNVQIPYATATATQRNTWLVNNADRVLFGAPSKSNAVSGVYAAALLHRGYDGRQKLSAAIVTLAKRIARPASSKIRPIRVSRDEEWYVLSMPSLAVAT